MSKQTLNLYVEKHIKELAKRIAKNRGISVSKLFEEAVQQVEDPLEEYSPKPGSAAERIYNVIPESEKLDHYDYKKLKMDALKKKYDL